tara:strand:+ start:233 stop:442 length:210 start_codon:yes stop_codon:yes gene_type:complete
VAIKLPLFFILFYKMDEVKALEALMIAQAAKQQMAASNSTLQPTGLQMGAIGKPNGYIPSTQYSGYNRV